MGRLQDSVQGSLQSGKLHRRVEQADFRLPIYLVVKKHHNQGHFQKGVQKEARQLKQQLVLRGS